MNKGVTDSRLSGLVTLVSSLFFTCAFPANGASPLHDWSFSKEAISAQAINSVEGNLKGSFESRPVTNGFGVRFDGSTSLDIPGMTPDQLPSERITADAWVSLDAGTRWGSIVGFYQDNGSY